MTARGRAPNTGGDTFLRLDFTSPIVVKCQCHNLFAFVSATTYRLEYSRDANSCEGEPAPGLELPMEPGAGPNGILELPGPESLGELRPVEVPDMG